MRRSVLSGIALVAALALAGTPVAAPSVSAEDRSSTASIDSRSNSEIFPGGLYLDRTMDATKALARAESERRWSDAALIRQISDQPTAVWLGSWLTETQLKRDIAFHVAAAREQRRTPVFVTYAVPNRDCGGHSAGGLSPDAYASWNRVVANALWGTGAVVLVEPDGLSMLTNGRCPGEHDRRIAAIKKAVDILTGAKLTVYIDAANSAWVKPEVMAPLLEAVGVSKTRGFVTNVSNFRRVDEERAYAEKLSRLIDGKHFVIDVSRNGRGWVGGWCNPPGAALGQTPRVTYGTTKLDALLWVKHPGESDGSCNGGPKAGDWFESYALDLVRNR